ncbi:MAG: co-chaperone GroES [Gemmatimonadota bacterium]|nr:MAG: co-chaperone GroES [Gemmatimonadota bacterium]
MSVKSWNKERRCKVKIKPLRDKVVVMRLEEEEKKVGGIIIPDTAKEKPMQGKVMAVGPGAMDKAGKRIPMEVKKGDTVLFGKYSGTEVSIDGKEYLIMDASDIYAIIG